MKELNGDYLITWEIGEKRMKDTPLTRLRDHPTESIEESIKEVGDLIFKGKPMGVDAILARALYSLLLEFKKKRKG